MNFLFQVMITCSDGTGLAGLRTDINNIRTGTIYLTYY